MGRLRGAGWASPTSKSILINKWVLRFNINLGKTQIFKNKAIGINCYISSKWKYLFCIQIIGWKVWTLQVSKSQSSFNESTQKYLTEL